MFGVKRRDGQDVRVESITVRREIVHLKVKSYTIKTLLPILKDVDFKDQLGVNIKDVEKCCRN